MSKSYPPICTAFFSALLGVSFEKEVYKLVCYLVIGFKGGFVADGLLNTSFTHNAHGTIGILAFLSLPALQLSLSSFGVMGNGPSAILSTLYLGPADAITAKFVEHAGITHILSVCPDAGPSKAPRPFLG